MTFEAQRLVESSSHSQTAGFPLFTGAVFQPQSPSFTGRPFIEGPVQAWPWPRIRRRRPLRDGLSLRENDTLAGVAEVRRSPSFTGRPFIEGRNDVSGRGFPSGCRRPLRDGLSLRDLLPSMYLRTRLRVAVLYGTAFH